MLEKPVLFIASVTMVVLLTSLMACGELGDEQNAEPIQGSIRVEKGANLKALATITPEAAKAAALARFPGATAEEADLESEDGFLVYEVEIKLDGDEIEVLVDAGTGAILRAEGEDLEDEHDEGMEAEHDEDGETDDDDDQTENAELPEAVEQAFRTAYPTAVIVRTDAEEKDGILFYEIESKDGDQQRDLLYRPDGTLYEFEEPVAIDALPEAVRAAAAMQGSIEQAERITRGEVVEYEIHVKAKGTMLEVVLGANGQVIERKDTTEQ